MSLLQNLTHTIYFKLEDLKTTYPSMIVSYGLPETAPAGVAVALEHDKTKVDEHHELSGLRKRPRVFRIEVYAPTQAERNNITEAIKDMFENKVLPVLDATRQDTGDKLIGDGVRVEVDLTQRFKANIKLYLYTLVN